MSEPAHILVVDDHDEIRNSVSSYLERNGMRTSVAESAAEMDAQRARHSFDLIVLDVMMPGEDGLTACKRLRQECGTPVLMLAICWLAFRTDKRVRMNRVTAVFLVLSVIVIAACLFISTAMQLFGSSS